MQRIQGINKREQRIDYSIILCVVLLAIISVLMMLATTYLQVAHGSLMPTIRHLIWYSIGIVAVIVIMMFDSEQLWKFAPICYWAGVALLVLVLIFHDRATAIETGARSWFRFGPLTFQPSEVVKLSYILMLARVVTQHNSTVDDGSLRSDWLLIRQMLAYSALPLLLVILQNDLGTTLVFMAILAGMLMMSGISWKILLPAFLTIVILGGGLIFIVVWDRSILLSLGFKNYQFARIDSWLNPYADQSGRGFQLFQTMKAIGSGGLFGKGYAVSQVYVPVRESDMIFATIGENFGFMGGCVLLLVYFVLIYQMIRVCFHTKSEFYTYIASGVISMILFHVLENVGMCIGLLPLTGIPLPFISQGGSALVGNMMGIGLILSMKYHYNSSLFTDNKL